MKRPLPATTLFAALTVALGCSCATAAETNQGRAFVRNPEKTFFEYIWSYTELQQRQIVMQQQDYSCGAAVLATVIRYYWGDPATEEQFLDLLPKLKLKPAELKDRIENGLTLTDLRDLANKAGYEATMGKVKFDELRQARVPVIVGVTVNGHDHFVVYRGVDREFVYLADPLRGNIRVLIPTFQKQWQRNGILVVAKPNTPVKTVNPMGVRSSETARGALNDQTVRQNYFAMPKPFPVRVGP